MIRVMPRSRSGMSGNASKSNREGTLRQAWRRPSTTCSPGEVERVLTHCTWEKTTVATSRPGSNDTDRPDRRHSTSAGMALEGRHGRVARAKCASVVAASWRFFLDSADIWASQFSNVNTSAHLYWHRARARLDDRAQVVDSRGAASPRVAQSVQARWRRVAGNAPR